MKKPQEHADIFGGSAVAELKFDRDFQILETGNEKYQVQFINPLFRGKNGLVVNYAPWCPHCRDMAPTMIKLANLTRGLYPVGAINCYDDTRGNNLLADYLNITGYPTIKYLDQGNFKDYTGGRELKDFLRFLCVENGLCELI